VTGKKKLGLTKKDCISSNIIQLKKNTPADI